MLARPESSLHRISQPARCPTCGGDMLADAMYDHDLQTLSTPAGMVKFQPRDAAVFNCLWQLRGRIVRSATLLDGMNRVCDGGYFRQSIWRLRQAVRPLGLDVDTVRLEGYRLRAARKCEG